MDTAGLFVGKVTGHDN